jgi:long-chain acyl-CoA synthetase
MAEEPTRPRTRAEALARLTAPGERYELRTEDVAGIPCRVFVNAPTSLRSMFEEAASDREFIVYGDDRLTFAEAWDEIGRIGAVLFEDLGVRPGDRVAIAMRNYPEWMTTFAAVTSIGAIAVAMNALWGPEEMEFGLADCGATVLVADEERVARAAACTARLGIRTVVVRPSAPADAPTLAELTAARAGARLPDVDVGSDDPATLFYTSGSTGHPKGVLSTHRNVLSALLSWELDARVARRLSDRPPARPDGQAAALLGIPLFHVTGSHAVYLQSYRAQRKLVSMFKWDPELAAEIIERERITTFLAPAALTGDLVRVARASDRDLSSLLIVGGGGAPRAPEQVAAIGSSFGRAKPNTGWGMTETNAIGTGIGEDDYLTRPESSGRVSAVLDIKVVDERGAALPAGEAGELLVRGTSVFRGYWNRPEVDAEAFVDGWFRSGDVAYLDDEGYLFIVDRIKDLIIRGGENIGCGQVEAALLLHPSVHEAAVYALPDERLGEEVGATVFADPPVDPEELQTFVRDHLAAFEVPREIVVSADPLPRTASGKIVKREVRAAAISIR